MERKPSTANSTFVAWKGDLGMIAAYCVKKLNAHARIDQSRARSSIERKGLT